jgi:hypothetical protein
MNTKLSGAAKAAAKGLLLAVILAVPALAQETIAMLTSEPIEFSSTSVTTNAPVPPDAPSQRRFWDAENGLLLAAAAGSNMADFAVTRANLQSGGRELNPVTRVFSGSTAGLAVNFIGETVGTVGLSYYFHKTGHYRLERMTPMINFASSAAAVSYGLSHRR